LWRAGVIGGGSKAGVIAPRSRGIDVIRASISTFEVPKMASKSQFFVHEAPRNAFYKLKNDVLSVPSARSKALESGVLRGYVGAIRRLKRGRNEAIDLD